MTLSLLLFFFFKQKTAYEMRISDWSSDVCSSDLHGRHVGNQHSKRGSNDHQQRRSIVRGHGYRRNLCFVAHFGKEKSDKRCAEDAESLGDVGFLFFDFVGNHRPDCHPDERQAQDPAQYFGADSRSDPRPQGAGKAVIDKGGSQNTKNDGYGLFEAGCKDEGQKLCFIADFSKRHNAGRDEKGFHTYTQAGSKTIDYNASPARSEAL